MPRRLLELVYSSGPVLDVVFAAQRRGLTEALGREFLTLELQGHGTRSRAKLLQAASRHRWDALLIRGVRGLGEALPFFLKTPFFLDHVGDYEFGQRGELAPYAFKLKRAFCYSPKADADLRRAGFGKLTMLAGPCLPLLREPPPNGPTPVLGVLDTGHGARQALARIKSVRSQQGWDFEIVTTLKDRGARQVDNHFEVAEQCNLLACPMEFKDQGTPHEGALLALSIGRALATSQTSAIQALPLPPNNYVHVEKYSLGGYGTCWEVYRRSRSRFDDWASKAKTDHTRTTREILQRM